MQFEKVLRLLVVIALGAYSPASAQMNVRMIKKRNTHLNAVKADRVSFKNKEYQMVGLSVNAMNYYGDLAPLPKKVSSDIRFTRPAIGLFYAIRKGPRFTVQTQFLYGTIYGSDASSAGKDKEGGIYRLKRNASFKNSIEELSLSVVFDLFDNTGFYAHRPGWTPYMFIGASVFHHNPKAKVPTTDMQGNAFSNAGHWIALRPLGTEGQYSILDPTDKNYGIKPYSLIQGSLLFGFGARYRFNEVVDLWLDLSYRYTATDYLDDVSRNYVDLGVLPSDLSRSLSYRTYYASVPVSNVYTYQGRDQKKYSVEAGYGSEHPDNMRGNKNNKDVLFITSIRISYIVGKNFHRPKGR